MKKEKLCKKEWKKRYIKEEKKKRENQVKSR